MSKVQYYYVKRQQSETGQTGTVTYDLPEAGVIPEIIVTPYSTPTASTDPALPLSEAITKIEIVDGATVIQSLSGNEIKGLSMLRGDHDLASPEVNDNAVEGHDDFRLLLGGFYNGTNYAPDFASFSNPQIKISWDYSLTTGKRGETFDADAAPAMKFTVLAKVIRDGRGYRNGYVKSSELYTWTAAASTTTQIEIPRGEPLLGLGIEAGYDAKLFTDDCNQVKLDFDNGNWKPVELYADEVIASQQMWFKEPFEVSYMMDLISGVEIDTHMGYTTDVAMNATAAAGRALSYVGGHGGVEAVYFSDVATPTTISTYEQVYVKSTGWCPYGVWYVPMSKILNGDGDTIDTTQFSRIMLENTTSAAVSTASTPAVIAEYLIA